MIGKLSNSSREFSVNDKSINGTPPTEPKLSIEIEQTEQVPYGETEAYLFEIV